MGRDGGSVRRIRGVLRNGGRPGRDRDRPGDPLRPPVELVEYEEGQHGVGLGLNTKLPLAGWSVKLDEWMRKRGLLEK